MGGGYASTPLGRAPVDGTFGHTVGHSHFWNHQKRMGQAQRQVADASLALVGLEMERERIDLQTTLLAEREFFDVGLQSVGRELMEDEMAAELRKMEMGGRETRLTRLP